MTKSMCIGCGSVGPVIAFDTRGPWFESNHRQNFKMNMCLTVLTI